MRTPTWSNIIRTFYTFSNCTARTQAHYKALQPFTRATIIKSMPTIPFLGSLFSSSSSSKNMSFPVQKSDDEWQAVLSKGICIIYPTTPLSPYTYISYSHFPQNNSASSAKRVPKRHSLANTTSICLKLASTPAPPATLLCIQPATSSNPAADGRPTSTAYQVL
jgi:hypothetical protein